MRNRTYGAAYGLGMLFSLSTRREMFAGAEHGEDGEATWPMGLALATLAGDKVLVALAGGTAELASAFSSGWTSAWASRSAARGRSRCSCRRGWSC